MAQQTHTILLILILCMSCNRKVSFAATFKTSTDESSLLAIKARITSDPHNLITTNWSRGTSFCTWNGVICSARHNRVAALNLTYMSLEGTIAPDIGNLSFLRYIGFSYNSFTGLIPDEIGKLRRLRRLYMWSNQLSGRIPWSIFNISSLTLLSIPNNSFSGSVPSIICPASTKLENLDLWSNQLTGEIPKGLSDCAELEILDLSYNHFNGSLPVDIGKLSRLRVLGTRRNKLTGTIPLSIGNLSNLGVLELGENFIESSIPSELGNLSNLTFLHLSLNKLKGEVPPSIFNLSRLETLSFSGNELSGSFPRSIDKGVPNLKALYLWGNKFTGEIPSSFTNLSKLKLVDLVQNSFSGLIPINLGNLQDLERIRFGNSLFMNDLSIPEQEFLTSLTNCTNLKSLDIGRSSITGVLPKSLGNLSVTLEILSIGGSYLRGTIPIEIGNLHNLVDLLLADNELSGEIPETLGNLRKLQRLVMRNNRLHGTIPNSICSLKNLFRLDLSHNKLSGHLTRCFRNLFSLRELYLYNNSFNSSIPSSLWSNRNLQVVSLSHNLFRGTLSNEIGSLHSLIRLDLAENQLSGSIPSTIGELQSLTRLEIQNNMFNGSISPSFGNLLALQYLDLSQNNLSGSIPQPLENLRDLAYFNVSFNQLSGKIPIGGRFINFTAELFIGNKGLCGALRLRVKACKQNITKSSRKNKLLRYILPPIASIIVAAAIMIFLLGRQARNSVSLPQSDCPFGLTRERISYYDILRATNNLDGGNLIEKGSIGSVYRGTFPNETTAAIKVFNLDVQGAFKSFDTECQIMRSLRHRNLVKVITSCSNLDFKALVMEYMPNGNLDKWLYNPNYPLTIAKKLEKLIDVASAIEYLHHGCSSPVVHCDLKPSNILLDEDMVAHVADFGISKLLTQDQRMEQTKTLGTIGYMAPEYGMAGLVSTKVDIYSYGIMLMETFTKKKPTNEMFLGELTMKQWVSESYQSIVMQIVDAEFLNVGGSSRKDIVKECLVSVMELAMECAEDSPEERPEIIDVVVRLKKISVKLQNTII